MKWVHQSCLKKWINISKREKCQQCNHIYEYIKKYNYSFYKYLDNRYTSKILTVCVLLITVLLTGIIFHFIKNLFYKKKTKLKFNILFISLSSQVFFCIFFIILLILHFSKIVDVHSLLNESFTRLDNNYTLSTGSSGDIAIFIYFLFYNEIDKIFNKIIKSENILLNVK
jgi:hypothetical protein